MRGIRSLLTPFVLAGWVVTASTVELNAQPQPTPDVGIFMSAISAGNADAIRALAAAGTDVNAPLAGTLTPLLFAVASDQPASVEALLDLGAEVPSHFDEEAIGILVRGKVHSDTMAALLLRGAAPPAPGGQAETGHATAGVRPVPESGGRYPVRAYSGPCGVSASATDGPPRIESVQRTLTSFYPADIGDVPAFLRGTCRRNDDGSEDCEYTAYDAHLLVTLALLTNPIANTSLRISPERDCAPLQVPPGIYTVVVEEFDMELEFDCQDAGCTQSYRTGMDAMVTRTAVRDVEIVCEGGGWDEATAREAERAYRERLESRHRVAARRGPWEDILAQCEAGELNKSSVHCRAARLRIDRSDRWLDGYASDCGRMVRTLSTGTAWDEFTSCLWQEGLGPLSRAIEQTCDPVDMCELIHDHAANYFGDSREHTLTLMPSCYRMLYQRRQDLCVFVGSC